jgi:hypothetical protein
MFTYGLFKIVSCVTFSGSSLSLSAHLVLTVDSNIEFGAALEPEKNTFQIFLYVVLMTSALNAFETCFQLGLLFTAHLVLTINTNLEFSAAI